MKPAAAAVPQISPRLLRWFELYSRSYLRRHFHSVRLLRSGAPQECAGSPLVIYLNHSSWWDPLFCLLLAKRFFSERKSFAPIEAEALRRYRFLGKLGFFPVENSSAGALKFLRKSEGILARADSALWITPQGKFVDHRVRPPQFERGLHRLMQRNERATFVPLAIEIAYWEERLPEVLMNFGAPLVATTDDLEPALAQAQDELSAAAQRRLPNEWLTVLEGRAGVGWIYDGWRKCCARLRGEKFSAAHSDL